MNSSASSTLESSSERPIIRPEPACPGVTTVAIPLLTVGRYRLPPNSSRPLLLAKTAKGIRPRVRSSPLEKTPEMVPSSPTLKSSSVPICDPSCEIAAIWLLVSVKDVTVANGSLNWRLIFNGVTAPVPARSIEMLGFVTVRRLPSVSNVSTPVPSAKSRSVSSTESA